MKDYEVDVLIVGGGTGGTAAAVSSRAMGQRVLVVEEFGAVGGQLTTQAVPPDEHPWIESTGCTASYRDFRNRVRNYYRKNRKLTPEALAAEKVRFRRAFKRMRFAGLFLRFCACHIFRIGEGQERTALRCVNHVCRFHCELFSVKSAAERD